MENEMITLPSNDYKEDRRMYGRKIIFADYNPEDLNEEIISTILKDVFSIHIQNANEIEYLENYYKGVQPILNKIKEVRPTINNKIVENNAYFVVEFKKGYVFGNPIQYVQRTEDENQELKILNDYMIDIDKHSKDTELAEDLYKLGIGYRLVMPSEDDTPFNVENLDPKTTFCVYSSFLHHKKLFSVTFTKNAKKTKIIGSVYTKNKYYTFQKDMVSQGFEVTFNKNHYLGDIPIFEYSLNKSKMGIIEVVMDIFNAINRVVSGELDGLEQYIQSIMVFVNQDIDADDFANLLDLGAIKIATNDPSRPADLKLLSNELDHNNTKILQEKLLNTALDIIGIPKNNDKTSGGDTGAARNLGEGWQMAEERAKQDEMAFKRCAKAELKLILNICKAKNDSNIKNLKVKDFEQKFTRLKTDNFLVKSQGMMNQFTSGIAPDVIISASGLYSDPNEVYNRSMDFYGGKENWIKLFVEKTQNNNSIDENTSNEDTKGNTNNEETSN